MAPKGKEGMYMGLALLPGAFGSWAAGLVSGPLIKTYLPEHGAQNPFAIWSIYAGIGLVCAAMMAASPRPAAVARSNQFQHDQGFAFPP